MDGIGHPIEHEALLQHHGYRLEGPGGAGDGDLSGRYWWTLYREGWGGVECGPDFASLDEAAQSALEDLRQELASPK